MAQKASSTRANKTSPAGKGGQQPEAVQNAILLDLPRKEYNSLLPRLKFVQLPIRTVLNEIAQPIDAAYFMNTGLTSIVTVLSEGKMVEVGVTGNEGFVGLPLIVGFGTSPTRAIVQIAGSAEDLQYALQNCPQLEKLLHRYSQELAIQSVQVAACNRVHEVEKRLARWLLMSQDRVGGSSFFLTQEFVAHMLGTRRASVTVAAGILQKAGLITYRRGQVTVEDRGRLERASCECYEVVKRQLENWHNGGRR